MSGKEGPFGASQGIPFDIDYSKHPPKSLRAIQLWTRNGQISAIKFTYEDEGGHQISKGPFGRTAGADPVPQINISSSEAVKKVFGTYTQEHITSFGVDTTQTQYPAKGNSGPSAFTTMHENIVAFFHVKKVFGSYTQEHITSFGVDTTQTEYPVKGNSEPSAFTTVNENIVAFFGRYNANGINAIGTYYLP